MISALGRRFAVAGTVLALTISPLALPAPAVAVPLPDCDAAPAPGRDYSGCDLRGRGTDFSGQDLTSAIFEDANLNGLDLSSAVLNYADLSGADLSYSNLSNAQFRNSNLAAANMYNATANNANFGGANLYGADIRGLVAFTELLVDADFTGADLRTAHLGNRTMTRTNFTDANLAGANLTDAIFQDANLSGARFADDTLTAVFLNTFLGRVAFESTTGGITAVGFNQNGLSSGVDVQLDSPFSPLPLIGIGPQAFDNSFVVGIELPGTVTSIAAFAFDTAVLTSVTIPASVATLGDAAFWHAFAGDSTITFLGSPPTWGNTPFGFDYAPGSPTDRCATTTCTMTLLYKDGVAGWPIDLGAEIDDGNFPAGTTQQPIYEVSFSAGGASGSPAESTVLQSSYGGPVTLSGQGTLSRPGYTFAGWQTSAGAPVSSPYVPTANITLVPRWAANADPAPEPSPSPSQAASNASSAPANTTAPTPAPIPTELRPGAGTLVVNGEPIPVTLEPAQDGRSLTVAGGGITLTVAARSADGRPIPVAADGSLILSQGGSVPVSGSGFAPGSTVVLYLFSDPIVLGEAVVGTDGVLSVSVPVPTTTSTGSHTIQIAGSNAAGDPLALSVGLTVESAAAAQWKPVLRVKKRTVSPGQSFSIAVSGVQPRCSVRLRIADSAKIVRTGAAGRATTHLFAPRRPGTWDVRATVTGKGCDPVTTTRRITVRRS